MLLDLDGVVRHFDEALTAALEVEHELAEGAILAAAFAPDIPGDLTCGRNTEAEWIAAVGSVLGSTAAAEAWGSSPGTVDADVLAVVDQVRAGGVPVGILTNGTDRLATELAALGVEDRFDRVFNSAKIGWAKPDVRTFASACESLGLAPPRVAFTDDTPTKLVGAVELGMPTHPFVDAASLSTWLVDLGVLPQREGGLRPVPTSGTMDP